MEAEIINVVDEVQTKVGMPLEKGDNTMGLNIESRTICVRQTKF